MNFLQTSASPVILSLIVIFAIGLEATSGACVDKDPKCASYVADHCVNPKYSAYSRLNCKKFCNLCNVVTFPGECVDKDPNCATYVKGHCTMALYIAWAKSECKKFCGYCDCKMDGKVYKHGKKVTKGCKMFTCKNGNMAGVDKSCSFFKLPNPTCNWNRNDGYCCNLPSCPAGIAIKYPAWWASYKNYIRKV